MQEITIHFQQMNGSIQPEFITRVAALAKEYGIIINSEVQRDMNEDELNVLWKNSFTVHLRLANELVLLIQIVHNSCVL